MQTIQNGKAPQSVVPVQAVFKCSQNQATLLQYGVDINAVVDGGDADTHHALFEVSIPLISLKRARRIDSPGTDPIILYYNM